jgi:hypothetical protein
MALIPVANANKHAERLLTILTQELGCIVHSGSGIEDGILSLWDILEVLKNPPASLSDEVREKYVLGAGVHDLASKVCAVWDKLPHHRAVLEPHLRELAQTMFIGQNRANPRWTSNPARQHDDADKVIELYWGCLCLLAGMEITLDDPVHSSGGKNPDVIATASDGTTWAFAIKTLAISSRPENIPMNFADRLEGGIDQIEASSADKGLVVMNLKNVIDHERIASSGPYMDWGPAHQQLGAEINEIETAFHTSHSQSVYTRLHKHPRIPPVAAIVAHTTAPVVLSGVTVMTQINAMIETRFPRDQQFSAGSFGQEARWLLMMLNDVAQRVR